MDLLKKFFPYSFGANEVKDLVIKVIVYVVAAAIIGVVIGLLSNLPNIGVIIGLLGGLVDLYCTVGIVLTFLAYFKVLK